MTMMMKTLLECLCVYLEANGGHCTMKLLIEHHINAYNITLLRNPTSEYLQ